MMWRMLRTMRTKLRDVGGQKTFIFKLGDRENTCGLLYYEARSTGANSETYYISNFKEFHHMCLCNFYGTKKQQQKRALWVMGTLPMANRTKGAGRGDVRTKVRGVRRTVERSPRGVRSGVCGVVPERIGVGWE